MFQQKTFYFFYLFIFFEHTFFYWNTTFVDDKQSLSSDALNYKLKNKANISWTCTIMYKPTTNFHLDTRIYQTIIAIKLWNINKCTLARIKTTKIDREMLWDWTATVMVRNKLNCYLTQRYKYSDIYLFNSCLVCCWLLYLFWFVTEWQATENYCRSMLLKKQFCVEDNSHSDGFCSLIIFTGISKNLFKSHQCLFKVCVCDVPMETDFVQMQTLIKSNVSLTFALQTDKH